MSDDLIERLTDAAATIGACDDGYGQAAVLEAVAEITRLRADVERLTQERDAAWDEHRYTLGLLGHQSEALADERRHADALADAVERARNYIEGPMIDRIKPMLRQCDDALAAHRARRQG